MRASGGRGYRAARASAAHDPGDAERDGVLKLGKRGELGCLEFESCAMSSACILFAAIFHRRSP